jgi:hypothetical protein
MKACDKHDEAIVVFAGDVCPFCRMGNIFKTFEEELDKIFGIMKQLQSAANEAGLKSH